MVAKREVQIVKAGLLISLLFLFEPFSIIGPAHLSYASNLPSVAERRVQNGWGLDDSWQNYDVLAGATDCYNLGRSGWLITSGSVLSVIVVDCAQAEHGQQMKARGLLADVNRKELVHGEGWLILR